MLTLTKFSSAAFVLIVFLTIAISMFNINVGALIWALICLTESGVLYRELRIKRNINTKDSSLKCN